MIKYRFVSWIELEHRLLGELHILLRRKALEIMASNIILHCL